MRFQVGLSVIVFKFDVADTLLCNKLVTQTNRCFDDATRKIEVRRSFNADFARFLSLHKVLAKLAVMNAFIV
jgi:hypothetical protein